MSDSEKIKLKDKVDEGLDDGMMNELLKNEHLTSAQIMELPPFLMLKLQSAWKNWSNDTKPIKSTANESSGNNGSNVDDTIDVQHHNTHPSDDAFTGHKNTDKQQSPVKNLVKRIECGDNGSNVDDKKDDPNTYRSNDAVPSRFNERVEPTIEAIGEQMKEDKQDKVVVEVIANNPETVPAEVRTKDDKSGKDHVGYLAYALVLAILVHKCVQPPCVFGLYAAWGTGKSFITNKTIVAIQMVRRFNKPHCFTCSTITAQQSLSNHLYHHHYYNFSSLYFSCGYTTRSPGM